MTLDTTLTQQHSLTHSQKHHLIHPQQSAQSKTTSIHYLPTNLQATNPINPPAILRHKTQTYPHHFSRSSETDRGRKRQCTFEHVEKQPFKKRVQRWVGKNSRDYLGENDGIVVNGSGCDPNSSKSSVVLSGSSSVRGEEEEEERRSEKEGRGLGVRGEEEQVVVEDRQCNRNLGLIFIEAAQRLQCYEEQQRVNGGNGGDTVRFVRDLVKCSVTIAQVAEEMQRRHVEMLSLERNLVMGVFEGNCNGGGQKRTTKRERSDRNYRMLRQKDNWVRREEILKEQTEHKMHLKRLTRMSKRLLVYFQNQETLLTEA